MSRKLFFEVIIVGGSYAGMSAALGLARVNRRVLIIDDDKACNRHVLHSHNLLTRDGLAPSIITAKARRELDAYKTVTVIKDTALRAEKFEDGFRIHTRDNHYDCSCLLFATGVSDILPDIPGFKECWGKSILHCPYCHGYEVLGQNIAVLADSMHGFHLCGLLSQLTDKLTLLSDGKTRMDERQLSTLDMNRIPIMNAVVKKINHENGQVKSLEMEDGLVREFDAVFAKVHFRQGCPLAEDLGCEITETGHIRIDDKQRTTVAGVFAAGDNSELLRTLSIAIAAGTRAAFSINGELTIRKFKLE